MRLGATLLEKSIQLRQNRELEPITVAIGISNALTNSVSHQTDTLQTKFTSATLMVTITTLWENVKLLSDHIRALAKQIIMNLMLVMSIAFEIQ